MTDLNWETENDSLELMAAKLNQSSNYRLSNKDQLFSSDGYVEPIVEVKGGIPALASVYYQKQGEKPLSMKYLKRVQAVKRFQIFTANMTGSSLVGICFFAAVSPHFKELYLVASRQEFVGIYMNGKQIAEVAKSDPVIKPEMMRQHMLGPTGLELQEFCQEMTNTVQKFLNGVETFEL